MTHVTVASPLRLATEAGMDAGRRGGNAVDAALATAAVLTVAYPASCAIGGDLLALVREPDGRVTFINASGKALRATDADAVRSRYDAMPIHGPLPITVPGMVGGWDALMQRGATLPWADLLAPARAAATDGVPVAPGLAESIAEAVPSLGAFPDLGAVLAPNGSPLAVGETLRQPALGRTFEVLSDAGSSALYDGELSDALCSGLAARGVPITREDLRDFEVEEASPLVAEVAGWLVQSGRPNSQAYMIPRLLAMLAAVESADAERPLHRRVPAHRLAFAFYLATLERDDVLGDPTAMTKDVGELLTPDAARSFAQRVVNSTLSDVGAGASTPRPTGDTVAVVAADDEGRSVSLIQSLFHGFGSLILEPTTGILMHDRGACFSLDPASPNALAPGKRPLHTLSPVLAESIASDGDRLVVGTMGGHAQPQILTQVLSRLIAGQSAQQSVSLPRMTVGAWDDDEAADTLAWEQDLDPEMASELGQYPGTTTRVTPHHSRMGHAHAIAVTAAGMDVGTDPRADG